MLVLRGAYDGCTANLILANAEKMISVNLGDSMAYLCRLKDSEDPDDTMCIPLQQRQHKCWMMKEKDRILRCATKAWNNRILQLLLLTTVHFLDHHMVCWHFNCMNHYESKMPTSPKAGATRSGGAVENGRINGILEVSRAFGDLTLKKFGVLCTPEYMKFQMDREKVTRGKKLTKLRKTAEMDIFFVLRMRYFLTPNINVVAKRSIKLKSEDWTNQACFSLIIWDALLQKWELTFFWQIFPWPWLFRPTAWLEWLSPRGSLRAPGLRRLLERLDGRGGLGIHPELGGQRGRSSWVTCFSSTWFDGEDLNWDQLMYPFEDWLKQKGFNNMRTLKGIYIYMIYSYGQTVYFILFTGTWWNFRFRFLGNRLWHGYNSILSH